MKRSAALKTLSFEHHEGLMMALHIKNGLKNPSNVQALVQYVQNIYTNGLLPHFEQEEESLLKILQYIPNTKVTAECVRQEHKRIGNLHKLISEQPSDTIGYIQTFGQLLNAHIRYEERYFFPLAEKILSNEQLNEVGKYLRQNHRSLFNSCNLQKG